jgi:hypothetical protein
VGEVLDGNWLSRTRTNDSTDVSQASESPTKTPIKYMPPKHFFANFRQPLAHGDGAWERRSDKLQSVPAPAEIAVVHEHHLFIGEFKYGASWKIAPLLN